MSDYETTKKRVMAFDQWIKECPENIAKVDYPKSKYNGRSFWTSIHITTDKPLDDNYFGVENE